MTNSANKANGPDTADHDAEYNFIDPTDNLDYAPYNWPNPLAKIAYHGIFGEVVKFIEPNCEGDPTGILTNLLVGFGNIVGRGAYLDISATRHHGNLMVLIFGRSALDRKDTARNPVKKFLAEVDPDWATSRVVGRFASGEGMVQQIRDEMENPKKDKDGNIIKGESFTDYGVDDKRLMCWQSEFADLVLTSGRTGNNLIDMMILAWDGSPLDVPTKERSIRCFAPHVSYCGNSTRNTLMDAILKRHLYTGFTNRFLYLAVRRSKILPIPGKIDFAKTDLVGRMQEIVTWASTAGEITFADDAVAWWDNEGLYVKLSTRETGLVGLATNRGAPQVLRLAMLFALSDKSDKLRRIHLEAAYAFWLYCVGSAKFVFGRRTESKVANIIMDALQRNTAGLRMTDLYKLFNGHISKDDLEEALQLLNSSKLARRDLSRLDGKKQWWIIVP